MLAADPVGLGYMRDLGEVETVLTGLAKTPGSSGIVGADPFNLPICRPRLPRNILSS